jgi:hypothetical protein
MSESRYPCDVHAKSIERIEKDINNMGKKYDTVLFGEKGDNGAIGAIGKINGRLALNNLYMTGISIMCVGIIGLLIRLIFFGPVK